MGLAEHGDDVRVCSIASLPEDGKRLLVDRMESAGIEVRTCDANHPTQCLSAYRKLMAWMGEQDADICQTFLFHANVLGTAAAKRSPVKVRVGGLRVAESNRIRCQIERWAVNHMDSLVCVSDAVQTFAAKHLRCGIDRSIVIRNGIDVSRFSKGKPFDWPTLGWPEDSEVVLFVGRMHPQKGIDQIQHHVDRIVPKLSKRRLLLVGEGPLQQDVDAWIRRIGEDRVKRLPWQADVGPLMRAARLLLLPSRYEGMPNVVLEAMAAARPVVSSRVEGIEELLPLHTSTIADQSLGETQSYRRGDDNRMLKLIDSFCNDERLAQTIGDRNQCHVRHHFSVSAMVDAYRQHYRYLLADREDER